MPEWPGKSARERSKITQDSASPLDASPSHRRDLTYNSQWWVIPNFSHLVIWWIVIIGYYVVFNSITGRYYKGLIDLEMVSDGWYVILASGIIGALYAKQLRPVWFLISIVLAILILLLMLLGFGILKILMNP